jgi:hypothetical protein
LRNLQEIHPDFVEEAKAYAGLWSQGKKKKNTKTKVNLSLCITLFTSGSITL